MNEMSDEELDYIIPEKKNVLNLLKFSTITRR